MLSTDKHRNLQNSSCCCFVYDGVRTYLTIEYEIVYPYDIRYLTGAAAV